MAETTPALDGLPIEVLQAILSDLDARSAFDLALVSKVLHLAVQEPLLWRHYFLRDFGTLKSEYLFPRESSAKHDDHSVDYIYEDPGTRLDGVEWKKAYFRRQNAGSHCRRVIRDLCARQTRRLDALQRFNESGIELKHEIRTMESEAANTDRELAQKYWARQCAGILNRSEVFKVWEKLRSEQSDLPDGGASAYATEKAIAGLDMFLLGSSEDANIESTLHNLDQVVRLVEETWPGLREETPRTRALKIAELLREKKYVGLNEDRNYDSIDNKLLGLAMRSWHRNSIPLISSVIYCYVCRRFGMSAQPISYPRHVHALIQPQGFSTNSDSTVITPSTPTIYDLDDRPLPTGHNMSTINDSTHLYMDPFNGATPISPKFLTERLRFAIPQSTSIQTSAYLSHATPRSLLIRSAHNLLNSFNSPESPPVTVTTHSKSSPTSPQHSSNTITTISPIDATYAALSVLTLFPTDPNTIRSNSVELLRCFLDYLPHDLANYETYLLPLIARFPEAPQYRSRLDILIARDAEPFKDYDSDDDDETWYAPRNKIKRRWRVDKDSGLREERVKFRVGQVIRHRRYNYIAVIYGWDSACRMSEEWIVGNGVDRLSGGRGQSFYNALVTDATKRYVAEENIIPISAEELEQEFGEDGGVVSHFTDELGKWFKRFDAQTGRFVSGMEEEYPED